ncbi:hypothetical protein [Polaribacter porphyrae]|uniref:DUF4129 domain-containing protein n=1 Tax=Polaribacter porphyrae TaxID=1137780 RepID=A0A2S7WL61_9FLAO|nr:hypothetical protein [Polaribacter porphyrae]PQJ78347.1 hypothetical protein BTO18_03700 [Polaribacter porphyrae]
MKKILFLVLLSLHCYGFSQDNNNGEITQKDTIVYQKDTKMVEDRAFNTDLKDTYSDDDFKYKEYIEKKSDSTPTVNKGFIQALGYFMTTIFPFLIGGFVIFLILKTVLGLQFNFREKPSSNKNLVQKQLIENEDIHEVDLDTLLAEAITNKEFRLAIRYYYLSVLKKLSTKELINYHKEKTNSEYLFEIENTEMRSQFSYLSYIYSYVWYGEFPVDEKRFHHAAAKYQSFINSIS